MWIPLARRRHRRTLGVLAIAAIAAGALLAARFSGMAATGEYRREIETWRKGRLQRLTSDEGWLVVAGLFWLPEGPSSFGSDPKNEIVLPAHSAPARAGVFTRAGNKVTVTVASGVTVTLNGKAVATAELRSDIPGPPDTLVLGALRLFVIDRDGRFAIRMRDLKSPRRAEFKGLDYFAVDPALRVTARFEPNAAGKTIPVPNVLGATSAMPSPGIALFRIGGRDLRLDAVLDDPKDERLFFIFRDQTAGKETYGAGRFLYADPPRNGQLVLDFNKAYTPPCAFTPYATCPIPPEQNRLPLRIEAGEKFAGHH